LKNKNDSWKNEDPSTNSHYLSVFAWKYYRRKWRL